jgi:hypothetical protein
VRDEELQRAAQLAVLGAQRVGGPRVGEREEVAEVAVRERAKVPLQAWKERESVTQILERRW